MIVILLSSNSKRLAISPEITNPNLILELEERQLSGFPGKGSFVMKRVFQ